MIKFSKKQILLLGITVAFSSLAQGQTANNRNKLWYTQPAANWNQALPIGNGRIGGMIFGNPAMERVQLNEATIWGGGPNNTIDSAARPHIEEVRALLAQKKYAEAQTAANKYLGPKGNSGMPYQLAGNLYINFPGHDNVTNYRRDLDISNATATVSYTSKGVHYKREFFTSFAGNVLMVRLSADKPGMINCVAKLQSPLAVQTTSRQGTVILSGKGSDHENQKGKIRFDVLAKAKSDGGTVKADTAGIAISNANSAVIYLSIATNFVNYHDISADPLNRAMNIVNKAYSRGFDELHRGHVRIFQSYFNRVKLNLGSTDAAAQPTDERIRNFAGNDDAQLAELYFQFGRYLLICSSQPGSQAANLQGIWNGELKGPWDSKYTININTEMNYWPSETTQLPELNGPLFDLISDVAVTGKGEAKVMYGARGWMLHHNTDIWRITGVVDGAFWGLWPTANAWLCQHIWEHYLFTGDKAFLAKYYPVMKGAAQYFIDVLQKDPDHNWLVVSPSVSPEHEYIPGKDEVSVSAGTTMDNQLVYGLFTNIMHAAKDLKMDKSFADSVAALRTKLPPMQVGKYGQLQEWLDDLDRTDDNHRHVSHLYGLFPGNQISPFRDPELFSAAKNSLLYRGDVSTGWSMAWKINLWAHLLDGNHAYKLIKDQIKPVTSGSGGTYPNFFDAHPPFQIDGNFGCTSGIAEMLVQSYDGSIQLLPAIPDDWKKGSVVGLAARGGFTVDMDWADHRITRLVIHSRIGGNCRVRTSQQLSNSILKKASGQNSNPLYRVIDIQKPIIHQNEKDLSVKLPESWLYDFDTQPGKTYRII
jgi:alpha-L-fucosidase 2